MEYRTARNVRYVQNMSTRLYLRTEHECLSTILAGLEGVDLEDTGLVCCLALGGVEKIPKIRVTRDGKMMICKAKTVVKVNKKKCRDDADKVYQSMKSVEARRDITQLMFNMLVVRLKLFLILFCVVLYYSLVQIFIHNLD